ncbi:FAD-dependent oxidoreductase [Qipengyuania flava]|uniref:FAD-dependent oxidoreductase n=1 Tax=Qipengyuania flava TaxID=192812 RepID=UPI001C5800C8|nr:FAD-dependent oxidoreductase [Qipengyuania flava]MBW3168604.1 FAD-dependent oxidoreductase [Qipengyuania flava]MBY5965842.1 FAD-dependent oxidoreductase [Qipengyuania flava]MBY6012166.1 FAD-dependent oxidoreductase [Qipengyuania flava]MBY6026608.1 FAD-dependent oxidoreductase [Qipengyuania flava]
MRHIAIVGSGPAGYYTAEAAVKQWGEDARVDIFDKLPVPFGLIRTGVAPDHQSIKAVARRYEKTAIGDTVRFAGNVEIGRDIAIEELTELYDAVILATGAPRDRDLPIPGADSANVFGSAAFVGWYNGHPEYAALAPDLSGRHAVIIGMGNVALDVARILSKTEAEFEGSDIVAHALERLRDSNIETITILGRRGPHQIMMTPKELGELLRLERAVPGVENADLPPPESDDMLDPGQRKSVTLLREFAALSPSDRAGKALSINFDFFASPTLIEQEGGNLSGLVVERTELKDGRAVGSGETYRIPADLLISCIGYRTSPIAGVPFDERAGRFPNEEGRIAPALYCVGWAKRGPSGTIGTNRPDGYAVIEKVAEDIGEGAGKRGREGFDELAQKRALDVVTFRDWQRIEEAEIAAARSGAPREKFVDIESMIAARGA